LFCTEMCIEVRRISLHVIECVWWLSGVKYNIVPFVWYVFSSFKSPQILHGVYTYIFIWCVDIFKGNIKYLSYRYSAVYYICDNILPPRSVGSFRPDRGGARLLSIPSVVALYTVAISWCITRFRWRCTIPVLLNQNEQIPVSTKTIKIHL